MNDHSKHKALVKAHWFPIILCIIVLVFGMFELVSSYRADNNAETEFAALTASRQADSAWRGDNKYQIPTYSDSGRLIWYGRELIANTSFYLGPKGKVAALSNGMNCQNCHLDAGTIPFANNFGRVYPTYPQFRTRSNAIQTIYGRINDCMERSMNGKAMDTTTREMRAIYAYMKWLGDDVPKGYIRAGTGLAKIKFLPAAADPVVGRKVYRLSCQSCHGGNGEGQPNIDGTGYIYPPLWGPNSYNDGAGLYRVSSFAAFVKTSMPFGADYHEPKLTDEEAWDVAAFVNSQARPHFDQSNDWKNLQNKPVDYPFGPFTDSFSETRHKYGPFAAIVELKESKKKSTH